MIEQLKDLEQEAMDNLTPEEYEAIVDDVMGEYDQSVYQCGYIDGLQTAIRLLSENSKTMSYSIDMEDVFDDEDEETAQEYED